MDTASQDEQAGMSFLGRNGQTSLPKCAFLKQPCLSILRAVSMLNVTLVVTILYWSDCQSDDVEKTDFQKVQVTYWINVYVFAIHPLIVVIFPTVKVHFEQTTHDARNGADTDQPWVHLIGGFDLHSNLETIAYESCQNYRVYEIWQIVLHTTTSLK